MRLHKCGSISLRQRKHLVGSAGLGTPAQYICAFGWWELFSLFPGGRAVLGLFSLEDKDAGERGRRGEGSLLIASDVRLWLSGRNWKHQELLLLHPWSRMLVRLWWSLTGMQFLVPILILLLRSKKVRISTYIFSYTQILCNDPSNEVIKPVEQSCATETEYFTN